MVFAKTIIITGDIQCVITTILHYLSEKANVFSSKNYSVTAIANELHRSKSTISRELKRNSYRGLYQPIDAQRNYSKRRKACRPHKRLEDVDLCKYVKAMFLDQQWSPEEIAGRLALEHHKTIISYSTIYREIYAGRFDAPYRSHGNRGVVRKLRHRGKTRHTKNHVERRGKYAYLTIFLSALQVHKTDPEEVTGKVTL